MNGTNNAKNGWRSWALGLAVVLLVGGFGWTWNMLNAKIDQVAKTQTEHGERLARIESDIKALRETIAARIERRNEQMSEVRARLNALESRRK